MEKEFIDLMNLMNYNLSRNLTKKSSLGEIQNRITDMFFKKKDLTNEDINVFATNLYTNPNIFSSNIDYTDIKTVGPHFNATFNNYQQSLSLADSSKTM